MEIGNDVDTDVIIPARYLNTSSPEELARHCMEDADPSFSSKVQPETSSLQVKTLVAAVQRTCAYCH